MTVNGGQLLARAFKQAGATDVFTLHGGHLDAFLVACRDEGIRLTDTRHESTAGHAADAYARMTGKPGICVTTAGPGYTNTYSAIANAYLDSIPVVFIVGSPPLREQETNPLQGGIDQIAGVAPITKWAHRMTNVERIPQMVAMAYRKALSGRPGPVLIEVPIDVMFYPVDESKVIWPQFLVEAPRPAPNEESVAAAIDALAKAERPVIITGGGAMLSQCSHELQAFAEQLSIPVFTPNKGQGIIPCDHPLWGGGTGALATLQLVAGGPPDVVIMLGCRMGLLTGGRLGPLADATIIQIDVDFAEMNRLHPTAVPMVADCKTALVALSEAAAKRDLPDFGSFAKAAVTAQGLHAQLFTDPTTTTGRLHPYFAAKEILGAVPPRTITVLDGGECAAWAGFFTHAEEPNSQMGTGYLGCLGIGQGFAIGAQRVAPDRPVLLIAGDGAVALHIAEFEAMARHGLPIVTVVFNNTVWGMSIHGQQGVFGEKYAEAVHLSDSAYEQVAIAFGGVGERVDKLEDLAPAVRRAFASGKPACINVAIDPATVHPVTPMMLGDVNTTTEVVIPYYENIPLS